MRIDMDSVYIDIWRMQASNFDDPLDDSPSPEEILRQLFKIEKCLGRSWQPMAAHRMQTIVIRLSSMLIRQCCPASQQPQLNWLNGK